MGKRLWSCDIPVLLEEGVEQTWEHGQAVLTQVRTFVQGEGRASITGSSAVY